MREFGADIAMRSGLGYSRVIGSGAERIARPARMMCVYAGPSESVTMGRNVVRVGRALPVAQNGHTHRTPHRRSRSQSHASRPSAGSRRASLTGTPSCGGQLL